MSFTSLQSDRRLMPKDSYLPAHQSQPEAQIPIDQVPRYAQNYPPAPDLNVWPPTPNVISNNKERPVDEPSLTYSLPEDYGTSALPWATNFLGLPYAQFLGSSNNSIAQRFDSPIEGGYSEMSSCESPAELVTTPGGRWDEHHVDYRMVAHELDDGFRLGSSYGSSDDASIVDASRYSFHSQPGFESDSLSLTNNGSRRISDASTSLSSQEHLVPVLDQAFDDLSHAYDAPPRPTDYTHTATPLASSSLSPAMSPRQTARIATRAPVRAGSRTRGSPSPHPTLRAAPYNMSSSREKRWSTGSYYSTPNNTSPYYIAQTESLPHNSVSRQNSPVCLPSQPHQHYEASQYMWLAQSHLFQFRGGADIMRGSYNLGSQSMAPAMVQILASNVDLHRNDYADLADPPDLYASLQEEQSPPPPPDMNPEDPDMKPHEQELRFEGDLYTPRWVRNHGNKREGWCGICKPGRWLVLKNSAFWYDKSFTHGICAATGQQFVQPKEVRRMDGNPDVWEGLCHCCNEWVALVSNKKKGTTWFRHAYKCHTHPKIKDAPKRRRESSHSRSTLARK